eukprot:124263-Alexandrium_andersonii.AAC.1
MSAPTSLSHLPNGYSRSPCGGRSAPGSPPWSWRPPGCARPATCGARSHLTSPAPVSTAAPRPSAAHVRYRTGGKCRWPHCCPPAPAA